MVQHCKLAAALLLAASLGCGCLKSPFTKTQAKEKDPGERAVPVEVAPVVRGPIESIIRHFANLEAEAEVKVFARTANRVVELLAEEGDQVAKDQVLLRLDDDAQKTAYAKAKARLEKAQQEYQRQQALYEQQLISEQAYTETQFELRQLELALEDARRELDYTEVRASIDGTISRRLVKAGDLVNVNQHLFDLVDFASIVARVYVPEDNLARLEVGHPARVRVSALGDAEYAAYVKRIAPVVESKTGTVKVTIGFREIGALRPGMYVSAEIIAATRDDALLLSKRSLNLDGDQYFVYRLTPERRVERVPVVPRLSDRLNVEPASGFAEGDQIVVAGQTGLKDGAKVRLPGDPDPDKPEQPPAGSASDPQTGN